MDERERARGAVRRALDTGKLVKPDACQREECGHECSSLQAHHESYEPDHWLDVIWLCPACHSDEHDWNAGQRNGMLRFVETRGGCDCLAQLIQRENETKWESSYPFDETLTYEEYHGLVGGIRD